MFCVQYSADANYIISGSDDAVIRLWKAHASDPVGPVCIQPTQSKQFNYSLILVLFRDIFSHTPFILQLLRRQKESLAYNRKLINRFRHLPEIRRIDKKLVHLDPFVTLLFISLIQFTN